MKKLLLVLCLLCAPLPVALTSCAAPATRVSEYKTLRAVGVSVDAAMKIAAQLTHEGKLPLRTWQQIAAIHDKFQPPYNLAVNAAQANLDSFASPDLMALAAQLTAVLEPYLTKGATP